MNKIKIQKSRCKQLYYVLIDESGTLPDPKDKFIVIAGVGIKRIKEAENLVSRTLKSLRQRKIKIKELKFYSAGERTKRQILSGIVSVGLEIFVVAVDKKGRKIPDTPNNFAILVSELINEINLWQKERKFKIIIDRHFHKKSDERNFNNILKDSIKQNLIFSIQHINSQENFVVNLADFVAGAVLAKYNRNDYRFYDIIKESILTEKILNWPELKRKNMAGK